MTKIVTKTGRLTPCQARGGQVNLAQPIGLPLDFRVREESQMFCRMFLPLTFMLLAACGPSEQEKAKLAEQKRIECLDKICPGDVEPKRDALTEVAIKLNGQWYIGPRSYGSPNLGPMVFFWPSRAPLGDVAAVAKAREVVKNKVGAVDNFYEVAIELFLRSSNIPQSHEGTS